MECTAVSRKTIPIKDTEVGYDRLRLEILNRAVEDYLYALNGRLQAWSYGANGISPQVIVVQCERFFRSLWFRMLFDVDVNSEVLIDRLKVMAESDLYVKRGRGRKNVKETV